MIAAPLLLTLVLGGADDLTSTTLGALKLKIPAAWKHSVEESSHKYEAPSEDASFELSVYPVDPRRDGQVCLEQLVKALGSEGWERISVGASPAARKVVQDKKGEPGEEPPPAGDTFQTHSYVGCNGATKWVLTFSMAGKKKVRFEPLAKRIVDSIKYAAPR